MFFKLGANISLRRSITFSFRDIASFQRNSFLLSCSVWPERAGEEQKQPYILKIDSPPHPETVGQTVADPSRSSQINFQITKLSNGIKPYHVMSTVIVSKMWCTKLTPDNLQIPKRLNSQTVKWLNGYSVGQESCELRTYSPPPYCPERPLSRFANLICEGLKYSSTLPIGPFLCFRTKTSVMPLRSLSGW